MGRVKFEQQKMIVGEWRSKIWQKTSRKRLDPAAPSSVAPPLLEARLGHAAYNDAPERAPPEKSERITAARKPMHCQIVSRRTATFCQTSANYTCHRKNPLFCNDPVGAPKPSSAARTECVLQRKYYAFLRKPARALRWGAFMRLS